MSPSSSSSSSAEVRLIASKAIGALVSSYKDEADMKTAYLSLLLTTTALNGDRMQQCLSRTLLTLALCLTHPEVGLWAITVQEPHYSSLITTQIPLLMSTNDVIYLEIISELLYHLASIEKGLPMLAPLAQDPSSYLYLLLKSSHGATRANAASALSKLAFKAKALEDTRSSETTHLLNVAVDIIKAHANSPTSEPVVNVVKKGKGGKETSVERCIESSIERAVEILASLVGRSSIKEELVYGSYRYRPLTCLVAVNLVLSSSHSYESIYTAHSLLYSFFVFHLESYCCSVVPILPYLFSPLVLSLLDHQPHSTLFFGLAHIIFQLTVTNTELHAAQLAEKGITLKQYAEMQKLQQLKGDPDLNSKVDKKLMLFFSIVLC